MRPDIEAIEARVNAATDGWELYECGAWEDHDGTEQLEYFKRVNGEQIYCHAYAIRGLDTLGNYECGAMEKPNAEFVFHARTDVPALIQHIRELEVALEESVSYLTHGDRTDDDDQKARAFVRGICEAALGIDAARNTEAQNG
jgi:hypothetical protein